MGLTGKKRDIIEFFRQKSEDLANTENLIQQAEEIVTLFHKVLKGFKLYPMNNPVFKKFAEDFKIKVDLMLTEVPVIPFRVKKNGFVFLKREIESVIEASDVSYVLFNDGIREIYFQKGVTYDEILAFFKILAKVTMFANEDYDIATLLWDESFEHIGYITEEELQEAEPFEDADFEQTYDLMAQANLAGRGIDPEKQPDNDVPFSSDAEAFTITGDEIKKFNDTLAQHNEVVVTNKFLKELTIKLLQGKNQIVRKELVDTSSVLWERLILFGAIKESVIFLKTLLKIGAQFRESNTDFYNKIKSGVAKLGDDDFLEEVFKAAENIDEAQYPYFGEFLTMVPPSKLYYIVTRLTKMESRELRLSVLDKVSHGIRNFEPIKALLAHDDWKVVRNALSLLKFAENPQVVPYLRAVINHPQKQIRVEAITVLLSYSVEEALPALEKAVFSPEKDIRYMCIEKILELKNPAIKSIVNRVLQENYLQKLDSEEAAHYIDLVVKSKRKDLYDLLGVLLFTKSVSLKNTILDNLALIDDATPILRHILKIINSPDFDKMKKEEIAQFIKLIKPEILSETLPALEKIFKLTGGMFNKNAYAEFKEVIISHINNYRLEPKVKVWFKKALTCGNKETEDIIKQKGGLI